MGKRRIHIAAVVVLLLVGTLTILWSVLDWPPVLLILAYGFPPAGEPTGNVKTIEGVEFVELKPGYCRVEACDPRCIDGDWLGRLTGPLRLPFGSRPHHIRKKCRYWYEVRKSIWISSVSSLAHFRPNFRQATEGEAVYLSSRILGARPVIIHMYYDLDPEPHQLVLPEVWLPSEGE